MHLDLPPLQHHLLSARLLTSPYVRLLRSWLLISLSPVQSQPVRSLDRIGCGEPPGCSPKTLKAMLDAGLIVDTGGEVRRNALGAYTVPSYGMPIAVHYQWCSAVAFTDEEMEAFEAKLEAQA
ncbi:hypothetical protein MKK65_11280 [Methylobacterium sp. J-001]|uniref:hypothetical protein n=1 Tax=Methylobacterium sp. J-001 TaxID=2836609 RepID=UPI001FB9AF9E|nr:hypothetical protein [Methylobacterium sp. J-001]MCJ2117137.1 hypothetical protein [Methylobacterium sp. J-001]